MFNISFLSAIAGALDDGYRPSVASVSQTPPVTSGLILDLDPELQGGTNGVRVTVGTDYSGASNNFVEAAAGRGPWYESDHLGYPCWNFYGDSTGAAGNLGGLITTSVGLCNLLATANQQFEVIDIAQHWSAAQYQYGGWSCTTSGSRFLVMRAHDVSATYRKSLSGRFSAAPAVQSVSAATCVHSPQVTSWSKDASQVIRVETDGAVEHSYTYSDTGYVTPSCDRFTIGCSMIGSSTVTYASRGKLFRKLIFNRRLTTPERAQIYAWIAAKWPLLFARKKGISGASTAGVTYVIPRIGQSNQLGLGETLVQPTANNAWTLGFDNVIRPAFEPSGTDGSPTISGGTPVPSFAGKASQYSSTNVSGGFAMGIFGQSMAASMLNRLRSDGVTDDLLDVPCCVGGTASAAWASAATTSPPPTNGLIGMMKHRLLEAMRNVPNPVIAGIPVYQMESDATSGVLAAAGGDPAVVRANYVANWNIALDEIVAFVAANSWTWADPTQKFFIFNGTASNHSVQVGWDNLRLAVAELIASRTDSVAVEGCDGPWIGPTDPHVDTGTVSPQTGQLGNGDRVGALISAAVL